MNSTTNKRVIHWKIENLRPRVIWTVWLFERMSFYLSAKGIECCCFFFGNCLSQYTECHSERTKKCYFRLIFIQFSAITSSLVGFLTGFNRYVEKNHVEFNWRLCDTLLNKRARESYWNVALSFASTVKYTQQIVVVLNRMTSFMIWVRFFCCSVQPFRKGIAIRVLSQLQSIPWIRQLESYGI